jgi:hypothetical protein
MTEQRRGVRPPVIDRHLAEELDQYRGLWVAIEDGHVVASGDTLSEALDRARERSFPDPLMYRVPKHPERQAFYRTEARLNAVV